MKNFTIGWLNKCRCGNKSHTVKTARGNETALWDDDAVKCNSCGRGGVIQVYEGQARVLWETDEEMAEGKPMSNIPKELTKERLIEHLRSRIENRKGLIASIHIDRGYRDYLKLELRSSEIALASLEAEPAGIVRHIELRGPEHPAGIHVSLYSRLDDGIELYIAPPAPVSVPDFGALTKCIVQRLVDYGAADDDAISSAEEFVYNACRAAILQGAEIAESPTTMQTAPTLDSSPKISESPSGNSQVIADGGEHGFCQRHPDTRRLTHPYKQLLTYPPRPSTYCPKCDPEVSEWVERDKLLRQNKPDEERPYTVVMPGGCQHEWVHHVPCSRLKPEYEECYKCGVRRPYPAAPQQEVKP
ncbi:hypothetical protein ACRZTK_004461 [Enterobacter asburiae]